MIFRIGIENNNEGIRSIAWVLEHPGCFAYGRDEQEALANAAAAICTYAQWIDEHAQTWIPPETEIELRVEQTWLDYDIDQGYERVGKGGYTVEPFFEYDWKPLTALEVERGLNLLAWSHLDLLAVIGDLTVEQWAYKKEGERWDIAGVVNHIGGAEWWYLDRLGLAFPRTEVPENPLERIAKVRAWMNETLPKLESVSQVAGVDGELWSPRKLLRRALWHERDHAEHIRKLLGGQSAQ